MKIALRVLLVLVAIGVVVWFGGRGYLARSVAQYDGVIQVPVEAQVDVTFDAKGVPQIWAKTDADAYFAMGWLHASERLFQMELVRRLARGELSEVFGEAALETDIHQRTIGFARRADVRALSPAARLASQRYIDGVNASIASAHVLPPEFVILRLTPRPWTLEDCLAITNYQTWFSHELMDQDQKYQRILEKLGMDASALTHAGHPWSTPTLPEGGAQSAEGGDQAGGLSILLPPSALRALPSALQITNASNSWVLAPSRSATHAALHASDPHLSIDQVPGLWYLAGLHSGEGLDVVGVTYAGAPFVVMGHNADVAFSFTVASVDLIDYYDDAPVSSVKETIAITGKPARVIEVHEGARGVMVDEKTSLHWAGFDFQPAAVADAALRLQKAKNFDDFRNAVTGFGALDANWIYSDRAGNIGYQLGAPVPIRDYDTYVRQNAHDPRSAWRGYRSLDETPHALNPAQGFLASCNNQPVSDRWPYPIPGFYDPWRIVRATQLLPTKHTVADMHAMQGDLVSMIAMRWKPLAIDGARAAKLDAEAQLLASWDGRMTADSRAATLFEAWWRRLPRAIFEDELADEWNLGAALLDEALTTRTPAIDDRRTPQVETLVDVSARAIREAKDIANGRTWGEACKLVVAHPLARVKALDWFLDLNRGPFPATGDAGSLDANFSSYSERTKEFRARVGPSMHFVLDWSNVDAFSLAGVLGQSGNPLSEHYDDFIGVTEWNVPFTRAKVFAGATDHVVMRR